MGKLSVPRLDQKLLILKLSPSDNLNDSKLNIEGLKDLDLESLRTQSWHIGPNLLQDVEYGLVLYKGIVQSVVKVNEFNNLDHDTTKFPNLELVTNLQDPLKTWDPWYLNVLVGHELDYRTSNRASVKTVSEIAWSYKMNLINVNYWNKVVKPALNEKDWLKASGIRQFNKLNKEAMETKQTLRNNDVTLENYAIAKYTDMFVDWILVKDWLDFKVVIDNAQN